MVRRDTHSALSNRGARLALGLLLAAALTGGCAGEHGKQRGVKEPPGSIAEEGRVCRYGSLAPVPEEPPPPCPEGLSCCYPCGVEGCDWVCADAETCASWSTLP
jgi:hypothetical protein